MKKVILVAEVMLLFSFVHSQDSVDVAFRCNAASSPTVFLVGEFNGWNNSATPMQFVGNNWWEKTFRLKVGGNPTPPSVGIVGAWQYKFYSGVSGWQNDPLNIHQNPSDNNNTYIYTKDPTIYQILPNQRQPLVRTGKPIITAFLFPKVDASIDTSSIIVSIDGNQYTKLGNHYDAVSKQLTFQVPTPLLNGKHIVIVSASSSAGGTNADTVNFTTQAGFIQITTQGGYGTYNPNRMIRGSVMDTSIHSVKLVHNSKDTVTVFASNGLFSIVDTLVEGINSFKAIVDTNGVFVSSDSVLFTLRLNHTPYAKASVSSSTSSQVTLSAAGSTDPDGQTLTFTWIDDPKTPLLLNGQHGSTIVLTKPTQPGEYYFYLVASNSSGLADTTRSYFIIDDGGSCTSPTIVSNPEWAKRARVYFLFPKAFTSTGTIPAAAQRLQYIHDMGFNVIWMMPVMKNAYPIDQHYGPGYNIVDFYTVAPEYGSNNDFKNFILQAHALGIKVILDVTPNHTSRFHPWSLDAHLFHEDSRYWTWYEHSIIPHNDNGLGQSLDADGFNYYSGFSDQLLNYNWKDIDARTEMINAYKYWIKVLDLDGYRFDVYWGPHRRYGEAYMGDPVREALKHIKPDILLLGEDDGTGGGTQYIYADAGGGLDAAYDFKLYFNQIRSFGFTSSAVNNLNSDINNGGYFPGPNSLFMRFMESQDEDRIAYFYSNGTSLDATTTFNRTKPMATAIFSVPGFPMIWNGQEVGWGYGISGAKEDRNRSTIGWNFQGASILTPHYQRLAWIRGTFPAFITQTYERMETGNGNVYGILRKYQNGNAISLCNFSSGNASVSLTLTATGTPNVLLPDPQDGKTFYASDVYNDSTYQITFTGGVANFFMNIPAYGSAVLIVSDSAKKLSVPVLTSVKTNTGGSLPTALKLYQNYPNPFNPSTTIVFDLPKDGKVSVRLYNVLGEEIAVLANGTYSAGVHRLQWDGRSHKGGLASSGVYFICLDAGTMTDTKKIILMK
ncbi:MAG: alpha-amylase family glycosyl hydrolase [Ignavibacteriales bacterium]|nr:alpha-amylase family glycosyl hydrolase [Ignavibacteriales bacterium]